MHVPCTCRGLTSKARVRMSPKTKDPTATLLLPATPTRRWVSDGSSLEEVVEKQADMIEYLKQHNTLLSKKILTLTSRQTRD
ncbi:transmembrane protein [Clarias magur]|uniref:Transmembrane protein n=1 Tax=Clarias magur TaxID=1594786 RepID=A0A8J4UQJ4_CLAMG|nr:transmembrane protein [Clarias magur]